MILNKLGYKSGVLALLTFSFVGGSYLIINDDVISVNAAVTDTTSTDGEEYQGQLPGNGYITGSKWTLQDGVLTIGPGCVNAPVFSDVSSGWMQYKHSSEIKKVVIEKGAIADDNITGLFSNLMNLTEVDVGNLDVSSTMILSNMFSDDPKLKNVDLSNWKMNSGTQAKYLTGMFSNDSSLKSINMSNLNLSNSSLDSIFSNLKQLTELNLDGVVANNVSGQSMFGGDSSLEKINLEKFYFTNGSDPASQMFQGMTELNTLTINKDMDLSGTDFDDSETSVNYKDWTGGSNTYTAKELVDNVYNPNASSENKPTGTVTWLGNRKETVDCKIKYLDEDTGDKVGTEDIKANIGEPISPKPEVPGYSKEVSDDLSTMIPSKDDAGKVYTLHLKKMGKYTLTVTQSNSGENIPTDVKPIDILYNDAENNELKINKLFDEIRNDELDTDDTYIDLGNGIKGKLSEKVAMLDGTVLDFIVKNSDFDGKTGSSLVRSLLPLLVVNVDNGRDEDASAVINLVYKNSSNNNNSHHSGGSSSNSEHNEGTSVKKNQTVATTTKEVSLYKKDGSSVTNRALGINTGWFSDEEYTIDGTKYYRVSTNEYVKADDVYVYVAENRHVVHVHDNQIGYLIDYRGNKITNRALKQSTDWITDRYAIINGEKYYRVATNEFVAASEVLLK